MRAADRELLGARARRGTWQTQPERRCAGCAAHADGVPACAEITVDPLSAADRAELHRVARGALRAGVNTPAPTSEKTAAELTHAIDRAVAGRLVKLAAARAAQHPQAALAALITPFDAGRLREAYGEQLPDPTEAEFAAAQAKLVSRRLSAYADDIDVASGALTRSLLARAT